MVWGSPVVLSQLRFLKPLYNLSLRFIFHLILRFEVMAHYIGHSTLGR